eukprot:2137376-Prymnesium_polylepis.1
MGRRAFVQKKIRNFRAYLYPYSHGAFAPSSFWRAKCVSSFVSEQKDRAAWRGLCPTFGGRDTDIASSCGPRRPRARP